MSLSLVALKVDSVVVAVTAVAVAVAAVDVAVSAVVVTAVAVSAAVVTAVVAVAAIADRGYGGRREPGLKQETEMYSVMQCGKVITTCCQRNASSTVITFPLPLSFLSLPEFRLFRIRLCCK